MSSVCAGNGAVSSIVAKWTTRSENGQHYVIEAIDGMVTVEFGPLPATIVEPLIAERRAWFELQMARFRMMALDIQGFVHRRYTR